jgi:hypothetical protein
MNLANLPNDIIKELINQTDDCLYLVNKRFYHLINELIEIWKKSIPMDITNYKVKNYFYYRKFHLELIGSDDFIQFESNNDILALAKSGNVHYYHNPYSCPEGFCDIFKLNIVYIFNNNDYFILIDNLGRAYHWGNNLVLNSIGFSIKVLILPRTKNITALAGNRNQLIFYVNGEFILYTINKSFVVGKLDVKIKRMTLVDYTLTVTDINDKIYKVNNIFDYSIKPVMGETNVKLKFELIEDI